MSKLALVIHSIQQFVLLKQKLSPMHEFAIASLTDTCVLVKSKYSSNFSLCDSTITVVLVARDTAVGLLF